jgi:putative transposase
MKVQLYAGHLYHIFNRSINREKIFTREENYRYFIGKLLELDSEWELIGYCLMPTHFHFLVRIGTDNQDSLRRAIGDMLSGYTKGVNKERGRTGSLFQQHTKAKVIKDQTYLKMVLHYIHQNPLRAGISKSLSDWPHTSYRDYCGIRGDGIVSADLVYRYFGSIEEFVVESQRMVDVVHL